METKTKNAMFAAIVKLLRPLIKILLRNSISFGAFSELAKLVYVDVANKEFQITGKKQTDSRVSIITGLSRKEVRRLKHLEQFSDDEAIDQYNRAARVIAGWVKDHLFTDNNGQPKNLLFDNLKDGKIRLLARAYLPSGDKKSMLAILGTDVSHLIKTIDHNISNSNNTRFFQRKVSYDNIPIEASERFRGISADEAQKLLETMDHWLAKHDRDVTPSVKGSGRKNVGLSIYYFEEELEKN